MNRRDFFRTTALALTGLACGLKYGVRAAGAKNETVSCCHCNACANCPLSVDIPKMIDIYNTYQKNQDGKVFIKSYNLVNKEKRADRCTGCRYCLTHCHERLNIPEVLSKVSRLYRDLTA